MREFSGDQLGLMWNEQKDARAYAARKRKMYQHDWKDWLNEEMRKLFESDTFDILKQRSDTSVNMFRWTIDELASIYSEPVHRSIDDTVDLEISPEVDMTLDQACKWTMATGEVLLRPAWVNGRMLIYLYPRDSFLAVPSDEDPLLLDAVVIEHKDSKGATSKYEVWTEHEWAYYDQAWQPIAMQGEDGEPRDTTNPYGVVPFVVAHSEYPSTAFWHGSSCDDLAQACLDMGVSLTDFNHLRHFQSYKQGVIKSDTLEDGDISRLKSDPTSWIQIKGATANAFAIDMQANLSENLNVALDKSQFTVGMRGARPTLVRGEESAASGYALKIKEHKKAQVWSQLRQLWHLWEESLWRVARVVFPVEDGPAIPEGKLMIDWPELGPGSSRLEVGQYVASITTIIGEEESLRELGYSEEDIQRILAQKMAETVRNPQVNPMAVPVSPLSEGGNDGV